MMMMMMGMGMSSHRHLSIIVLTLATTKFFELTFADSPLKNRGWLKIRTERPIGVSERLFPNILLRGGSDGDDHYDDVSADEYDTEKRLVIVIDVDNTLYSEHDLLSSTGTGIESQIVRNTYLFGLLHFNLTSDQCDELYKTHGSTIEGLRHTIPTDQVEETMAMFYREVYDSIDFSCLLGMRTNESNDQQVRSGYDHHNSLQRRHSLADFLKSLSRMHKVYLASNSPKAHVIRVINNMGLGGVNFAGILTPDMERSTHKLNKSNRQELIYPTKSSPRQYYKQLLERYPVNSNRIVLLDDSVHNLNEAKSVGIDGIHVNQPGRSLEEGLSEAIGHILPLDIDASSGKKYTFSDINYLRSKNKVDMSALNPVVWDQLAQNLALRLQNNHVNVLRIADLGAGILLMLELILLGGGESGRKKPSLLALINKYLELGQKNSNSTHRIAKMEYFAYESNLNLVQECKEQLVRLGFQEVEVNSQDQTFIFSLPASTPIYGGIDITIHLRPIDFREEITKPIDLDVIIGCCVADLFDPTHFVLSLHRFAANGGASPPLVYLPITFAGITRFDPAYPPAPSSARNKVIPSDTTAFNIYSQSLTDHGHNLDSFRIVNAMRDHGGSLISKGTSDWHIDPNLDKHLWETMIYFFGISGARDMITKYNYDASGWINRCRMHPRSIVASNVDLLFHMQSQSCARDEVDEPVADDEHRQTVRIQEIQFIAPYNVTTISKYWSHADSSRLSPDQVEIESMYSLISSGTELKIFNGSFDSASLDVNIKGLADKSMEYPLAYGYSLVGRVVACGSNVEDSHSLIGKLVFAFNPHSSRVIVDRDAIHVIPDDIAAEDAVFFPSVETALSLIHDANIRLGENVAVYGQGLIGLLVTSILSMNFPSLTSLTSCFGSVTTFDAIDERLGVSSSVGATSALKPQCAEAAGPHDVSIEVSGNAHALQSAIDNTSNNGRIVVGSWYGNKDVILKLGIDFHRSDKTIMASQVSTIPPALAGLWSKDRRFSLTWALVKLLKPSHLITKYVSLDEAQNAYEQLDRGEESVVCFKYGKIND